MIEVLVRCETPMLGMEWWETRRVTRTPFLDGLIDQGRLTVLETYGTEEPPQPAPAGLEVAPAGEETGTGGDAPTGRGWFAPSGD